MNTQTQYQEYPRKQRGFTLIEALIAFAVAGVGILSVVAFQTELISTSSQSKAKAEALQLAQERLEEFKNYSFGSADDFNASSTYADTTYANTTDESITGTNAQFIRDYKITTSGDLKAIEVMVSWTDPKDGAQNVILNTSLTYESQAILAAEGIAEPPTVTSATGDATIGAGTIDCGTGPGQTPCTSNGDGTSIAEDGGDLKLVIDDGDSSTDDKVVLTLEDACVSGTCTQFVQIRGSIYVDNSTQSTLDPDDVKVLSSDAGYCQRFYLKNSGTAISSSTPVVSNTASNTTTYYIDANSNGTYESGTDTTSLTPETDISTAPASASGDYDYFRYSCYLGGGWHGNIGILLSGGNSDSDHFCIGDPNAIYSDDEPTIAARRVYRGMTYKDVDSNPLDDSSVTRETYTLPDGSTTDIRYYSQGIMDGAELDDQDFVVASLSSADGDYCVSASAPATIPFTDDPTQSRGAMTRTDSTNGGLFEGVPADFVCLNQAGHKPSGAQSSVDPCLTGAADVGAGEISCHQLIDPILPYGADYTCPYDPTSPPNTIYTVSGNFNVYPSTFTTELGHWNVGQWNGSSVDTSNLSSLVHTDDPSATSVVWSNVDLEVNTSQSYGNCTIGSYTTYISSTPDPDYEFYYNSYSCDVYDWPDDSVTGWIGNIITSSVQSDVHCQTPVELTVTSDQTAPTFYCMQGDEFYISGTITDNSGDNISAITVDATSTSYDFDPTCTIADDFASYKCRVVVWTNAGITTPTAPHTTWSGTVRFTSTKTVCHDGDAATPGVDPTTTSVAASYSDATKTATYTGISIGDHINEDIALKNNYSQCTTSYP